MIIQRLQLLAAHSLRGRPDAAALIGEAESLSETPRVLERERSPTGPNRSAGLGVLRKFSVTGESKA